MNRVDSYQKRLIYLLSIVGVIIYLFTAFNSHGFYHTDEHYQLLEFARVKLETPPPTDLAWEFDAKIRSAFQPAVAYLVISASKFLGLNDPFNQVALLRLLTAILALLSIHTFYISISRYEKIISPIALLTLTLFIGILPFFNVRFSSETWSGLLFLLSCGLLLQKKKSFFLIGIAMGLSFLCRFQSGIFILGAVSWLLFYRKITIKDTSSLILGVIITAAVGFLIDSWFYDSWTFTSWNYFKAAVGITSTPDFGSQPWHFFFTELVDSVGLVFGLLVIIFVLAFYILHPSNIITWVTVPFILAHFFVPHKEMRFLLPIINFLPVMIMLTIDRLIVRKPYFKLPIVKTAFQLIFIVLVTVNSVILLHLSMKATGNGMMGMARFISHEYTDKPVNLIYCTWSNPFMPWGNEIGFYANNQIEHQEISSICELNDGLFKADQTNLIIMRKADISQHYACEVKLKNAQLINQSYPPLTQLMSNYFSLYDEKENLLLYEVSLKQD